jgi:alkylation response protein AidB-like acyl-CoA dehydrogenase
MVNEPTTSLAVDEIMSNIQSLSDSFAKERSSRQLRRNLHQEDFESIKNAGYLFLTIPDEMGGHYQSLKQSVRQICESLRILAQGDSSVALVSSMQPAVLANWLEHKSVPSQFQNDWIEQRNSIFEGVINYGHRWGTITSEPGSGGDIAKTKAIASYKDGKYYLSGQKHFGSGSGITHFMVTTAIAENDGQVDTFFLDMRNKPWDGSQGVQLIAEWDGHGMTATQSHGMMFNNFPVKRMAWEKEFSVATKPGSIMGPAVFTAVITGIIQIAVKTAKVSIMKNLDTLRPYDKVEWTKIETKAWLIEQAYEGMIRDIESNDTPAVGKAKLAVAEMADEIMNSICRVVGGGSFARKSPFGFWAQDVKALGFLRPPWPLAYDQLWESITK